MPRVEMGVFPLRRVGCKGNVSGMVTGSRDGAWPGAAAWALTAAGPSSAAAALRLGAVLPACAAGRPLLLVQLQLSNWIDKTVVNGQ